VEITLCGGEGARPYVVKRSLHADNNGSSWRLNGG
jgi:hypothetical protein